MASGANSSRISEKTVEVSWACQVTQRIGVANAIWFGLTQRQEAALGYDLFSAIAGQLSFLQFKASNVLVHPQRFPQPRRKFVLPHAQLANLQELAHAFPEAVYYVFPHIGTQEELASNADLVSQSSMLNVTDLPYPYPAPTNMSAVHYAYLDPPDCEIRSTPRAFKVLETREVFEKLRERRPNAGEIGAWIRERRFSFKGMKVYGLLIPAQPHP
jgi:hypothetical protein